MTLAGRIALVTGGTGALGQAVTLRFLAEGAVACVPWVVDEEHERLRAAVKPADAGRLFLDRCDVTDDVALGRFVEAARGRHGAIDVLVTLVGGFAGGGLVEADRTAWDRMLALNLTSAFTATRAVVPAMVAARRGRVITIGSRAVLPPAGGFIAYTTSKAGVIAFTQALAQELHGTGVTANCVLPSTMDTPGNRAAMPDADRKGWVPVESVAAAIAFLASDEARHVNGTLVSV
ncbi:MAG TPA: SDR family NAD(P)-dependent oxidoreductase [Methylomirabilota bacterium]|nr:SDR family NAD(P)-dependent oxidoreductase [Methylomirabilota bacterium]